MHARLMAYETCNQSFLFSFPLATSYGKFMALCRPYRIYSGTSQDQSFCPLQGLIQGGGGGGVGCLVTPAP